MCILHDSLGPEPQPPTLAPLSSGDTLLASLFSCLTALPHFCFLGPHPRPDTPG